MNLDKDINISSKGADGKYKTVISIKQGKYGIQVGVNRERLVELLKSDSEWINFPVFFNEPREPQQPQESVPVADDLSDEVPF